MIKYLVAPRAGAWIETVLRVPLFGTRTGRPLCRA